MCGRFVSVSDKKELEKLFLVDIFKSPVLQSYNVTPTQNAGVIINDNGKIVYDALFWGLIPSWSKDPTIGSKMINARSETIMQKSSFKNPFKRRRCLIPANGFYEWQKKGKDKIPYYIYSKTENLLSFAGLWEIWTDADGNEIYSFTIITTEAMECLKPIHHRSPVIITKKNRRDWLFTDERDCEKLLSLFKPYESPEGIDIYKVSTEVNNPKNNSSKCIKKVSEDEGKDEQNYELF